MHQRARQEYAKCLQLQPNFQAAQLALQRFNDDRGDIKLIDAAAQAGLRYRWSITGKRPINILQGTGNGCAFLDFDNDGNLDILLIGVRLALYKGNGQGGFTDVTQTSGLLKVSSQFFGCATGDYDNDGFVDLYISAYKGGALLHNQQGQGFRNVTTAAGLAPQPWGVSCAFADVDGDGDLDLYIGNYVKFGPNTEPQMCRVGNQMTACGPKPYKAERGVLYLNAGYGHFRDGTKEWGLYRVSGKNLGAAFADFDHSGRQSLALANDTTPGDLMHNVGTHFTNIGVAGGIAYDQEQRARAGMGIDWGDYDNDGNLDLVMGTFRHEYKMIAHNDGSGLFSDQTTELGMGKATFEDLTFGVKWADFDNDGWLDLALANGHVQDNVAALTKGAVYKQSSRLMRNLQGTSFEDVSARAGESFLKEIVGRGLATGDYDNDGRVDLLIVDSEGSPLLLHNETASAGHWLSIQLIGKQTNRDAIGALVTVQSGRQKLMRRCGTDGSYLSASDHRVHFGLGPSGKPVNISVRWPSGATSHLKRVAVDRFITIEENAVTR
jgi:hypothetical protein